MQDAPGPRTGPEGRRRGSIGEAPSLDAPARAEALVRSACSTDVRRARTLLQLDPALARHDLACACVTGEADEVRRRLARHPDLARASTGPLGREPILLACFSRLLRTDPARASGIREVVDVLLEAGADPDARFAEGDWIQSTLYGAAGIANDAALTRRLIEAGADPNDDDAHHTVGEALYHAVEFPDPTCARLLIEAGTKPRVVDYCLGRALNFPNEPMVQMMCAHGARPGAGHLQQAVWRDRGEPTVRALLDAGAPVDGLDPAADPASAPTPLQVAVRWGNEAVARLLLARGADARRVTAGDRALGAFLRGESGGAPAPGPALTEMLVLAIQRGDQAATRALLDAGAPVDGGPGAEHPPIGEAAWRGEAGIVAELAARGARLRFPSGGSAVGAALHGSRHCHHPEGGPTMQTLEEVPRERYAAVLRALLHAGAPIPEVSWEGAPSPATLMAELGVAIPA